MGFFAFLREVLFGTSKLKDCIVVKEILKKEIDRYESEKQDLLTQIEQMRDSEKDSALTDKQSLTVISELRKKLETTEINLEKLMIEAGLEEIDLSAPAFIDETKTPYIPYRQIMKEDGSLSGYKITNPREMYVVFNFQKDMIIKKKWLALSKYKKLMAIWTWMLNRNVRTYKKDFGDNWQFALDVYYRKGGDCEDGAILFITTCRAAGISPYDIFNALGPSSFGYHSYPIVHLDEDDCKEAFNDKKKTGWYVFETTINGIPVYPKRLLRSTTYWIDKGGMHNWLFSGQVKPKYSKEFNLKTTGNAPGKKIDNSKKKNEAIQKLWEKEKLLKSKR